MLSDKDVGMVLKRMLNSNGNVVFTPVKPIKRDSWVEFMKYIHDMENHHYFQYFMMDFRENFFTSSVNETDAVAFMKFYRLLMASINTVSVAYLEHIKKEEEEGEEDDQ